MANDHSYNNDKTYCLCLCTVGRVVRTLPVGNTVIGVTSLAGEVYLLRMKEREQVEVYDAITYRPLRHLTVPGFRSPTDMASCEHYQCVYTSDHYDEYVHRFDVHAAAFTRWAVKDRPWDLSVNSSHNVLVTCPFVRKIKEFSSHGDLLRELALPGDVINPWHTIQTQDNGYVVCHDWFGDTVNRVCKMSADGCHIVHSSGGQPGPGNGQFSVPFHLALDNNEFVFVADFHNRRVRLLSPTLGHVRDIVSHDQLKWWPFRMCLDVQRRRLYVTDNEWKEGDSESGRVVVFSI